MSNASSFDDLAVPQVGIFWLKPDLSGILCGSTLPVAEGELYGDYRINPTSHFDYWEHLNREGFLRTAGLSHVLRDDYCAVPRGRVSFHIPRAASRSMSAPGFSHAMLTSFACTSTFPPIRRTSNMTTTTTFRLRHVAFAPAPPEPIHLHIPP